MPSEAPPRRFAPEPVEISSKSNRSPADQDVTATKPAPRKFAVEPMETTSRSKKNDEQTAPKQTIRRFAPQPTETSSKSNRKADESSTKPTSKFPPQPCETTSWTNRSAKEFTTKPKSRFSPQPIETSIRSSRRSPPVEDDETSPKTVTPQATDIPVRRKFVPMLVDTSTRSRKAVDHAPTYSSDDKTDVIPGINKPSYHNSGQQVTATEIDNTKSPPRERPRILLPFERRRDRSSSNKSNRTHSFRLPDLETIESSESEPSNPPSLSSSPSQSGSPITTADSAISELYKHATRIRESIDEGVANYLLEIEARRAEEKLREQALAAFPNSDFHEPVEHYVDEEEDSDDMEIDDRPSTWEGHDDDEDGLGNRFTRHRETTHGNWELKEMQAHHEQLEQERNAAKTTRKKSTSTSPWWDPSMLEFGAASHEKGDRDPEMRVIRDQARPPMLGDDLYFPRSSSPEPARFDVTQGSHKLRHQMCYLTEQSGVDDEHEGLWDKPKKTETGGSHISTSSQGLWGGFCVETGEDNGLQVPSGPTGLMTPRVETGNPFENGFQHPSDVDNRVPLSPGIILPMTPPTGGSFGIDGILRSDQELDDLMAKEYPDTFVTQVYNYLSLGYPTLAQPFDEELSKISGVPISELRHDDVIAKSLPRGYIRLGDDFEGRGDGCDQELKDGGCARWKAMKLYIREWAKQEKNMVKHETVGTNWGTGARRGSWAW